jgi:hypothetical protein
MICNENISSIMDYSITTKMINSENVICDNLGKLINEAPVTFLKVTNDYLIIE